MTVGLSVIIPTRDRAGGLHHVLDALARQDLAAESFEVIVVDNGSTDGTRAVVEGYVATGRNVRYACEPDPGLHNARHRGWREARGEILVYADDDIVPEPTWLEAVAAAFTDPGVALVGGNNHPAFEGGAPDWLQELWDRPKYGGRAIEALSILALPPGRRPVSPYLVWGCNFAVRETVLREAGGFHPDGLPPELIRFRGDGETHISRHVAERGLVAMFDSRASVRHAVPEHRMTLEYFRRRAFNQGVSDSFSQLRAGPASGVPRRRRIAGRLRGAAGRLRRHARDLRAGAELRAVEAAVRESHRAGYLFHRHAYGTDPEVRAWVHRETYL